MAAVAPHKTDAGGFTERRYTPVDLLELMVLADLRRRGLTISAIRHLIDVLRSHFKVRLFEAIEGGGPITLFIDGRQIFARTEAGEIYNVLENPEPAAVDGGPGVEAATDRGEGTEEGKSDEGESVGSQVRVLRTLQVRRLRRLQGLGRSASRGVSNREAKGRRTAACLQARSAEPAAAEPRTCEPTFSY